MSERAINKSVTARAIRPFPSSKGWIVSSHTCATPAFITESKVLFVLNQSKNKAISGSILEESGAWKWIFSLPKAPDTTCIGPFLSVLHCPTDMGYIPERPVGKRAECQLKSRSGVSGSLKFWVASNIISTTPSTWRSEGTDPAISKPNCRAIEERTCSAFKRSPSISEVFSTSKVRVSKKASFCNEKPRASIFPKIRPCKKWTPLKGKISWSSLQVKLDQDSSSWM